MYIHKQIDELSISELITFSDMGYKLCYVDYERGKEYDEEKLEWIPFDDWETMSHMRAYFTPLPLNEQDGDDWDNAPYYENTDKPYDFEFVNGVKKETTILVIHFTSKTDIENGCVETPEDFLYGTSVSVDDINNKKVAWLFIHTGDGKHGVGINAGESPTDFVVKLKLMLEIGQWRDLYRGY